MDTLKRMREEVGPGDMSFEGNCGPSSSKRSKRSMSVEQGEADMLSPEKEGEECDVEEENTDTGKMIVKSLYI